MLPRSARGQYSRGARRSPRACRWWPVPEARWWPRHHCDPPQVVVTAWPARAVCVHEPSGPRSANRPRHLRTVFTHTASLRAIAALPAPSAAAGTIRARSTCRTCGFAGEPIRCSISASPRPTPRPPPHSAPASPSRRRSWPTGRGRPEEPSGVHAAPPAAAERPRCRVPAAAGPPVHVRFRMGFAYPGRRVEGRRAASAVSSVLRRRAAAHLRLRSPPRRPGWLPGQPPPSRTSLRKPRRMPGLRLRPLPRRHAGLTPPPTHAEQRQALQARHPGPGGRGPLRWPTPGTRHRIGDGAGDAVVRGRSRAEGAGVPAQHTYGPFHARRVSPDRP